MNETPIRALVTGGSGGIGAAICKRLGAAGHWVYVHANLGIDSADAVVGSIIDAGGLAERVCFDVTDATATREALEQLTNRATIQILINNAGVHDDAVFPGMNSQQWHRVIDVVINGFFNVTQPLILPMIRTRWGRVINISSVTSQLGNRGQVNYAAAKGALNAATKSLCLEVATRGITVNAVSPGIIATGMAGFEFDPKVISERIPMKRAGSAEEVASLVEYLSSKEAGYITGQVISVNGGMI